MQDDDFSTSPYAFELAALTPEQRSEVRDLMDQTCANLDCGGSRCLTCRGYAPDPLHANVEHLKRLFSLTGCQAPHFTREALERRRRFPRHHCPCLDEGIQCAWCSISRAQPCLAGEVYSSLLELLDTVELEALLVMVWERRVGGAVQEVRAR